jgi:hypothetical protein
VKPKTALLLVARLSAAVGIASHVLLLGGCARPITAAELERDGTRTYARLGKARVQHAAADALRTLGYEVTLYDEAQGRIKTAPLVVEVHAVGGSYGASASGSSLAWNLEVSSAEGGARVHAEPRLFEAGQAIEPTLMNAAYAERAFGTLFGEIDDQLGVGNGATAHDAKGSAPDTARSPPASAGATSGARASKSGVLEPQGDSSSHAATAGSVPPPQPQGELFKPVTPAGDAADPRWALTAELGFSSNDLDVGLGAHAGKRFFPHVYIGGAFVYHLGHTLSSAQTAGYSAQSSFSAFYAGPEGGYEFTFSPVLVRLYAGLGMAWLTYSVSGNGAAAPAVSASGTQNQFVVWPGAMAIYSLPDSSFFVGGDLRFVSVPGGPAVGFFASGGMRL